MIPADNRDTDASKAPEADVFRTKKRWCTCLCEWGYHALKAP